MRITVPFSLTPPLCINPCLEVTDSENSIRGRGGWSQLARGEVHPGQTSSLSQGHLSNIIIIIIIIIIILSVLPEALLILPSFLLPSYTFPSYLNALTFKSAHAAFHLLLLGRSGRTTRGGGRLPNVPTLIRNPLPK
ncbi:unnamed protein product [Pleuronectes platessa]|uniref:Uncharacterized protein n=1 Tax=Pleuronectes platessa TaxID=8262 RepID=A0A9N7UAI2_PLEPL|nr:unnamed protein product [Pleuronectes platessa]